MKKSQGLTIKQLDDDLIYVCTTCGYEHKFSKPEHGRCRAGRSMHSEGCQGKRFRQGAYWFRDGHYDWDRGCWHFVEVPKGRKFEDVKKEYIEEYKKNHSWHYRY